MKAPSLSSTLTCLAEHSATSTATSSRMRRPPAGKLSRRMAAREVGWQEFDGARREARYYAVVERP